MVSRPVTVAPTASALGMSPGFPAVSEGGGWDGGGTASLQFGLAICSYSPIAPPGRAGGQGPSSQTGLMTRRAEPQSFFVQGELLPSPTPITTEEWAGSSEQERS